MRHLLLACCLFLMLVACGTPRMPPGAVAIDALTREVRDGAAHSFARFAWLPGSAGFSLSDAGVRPGGQLVLRNDAMLWGYFDLGSGWFRVALKIPFNQIRSVSLAQQSGERLIVVEGSDGRFDSFGVVNETGRRGAGTRYDPAIANEAYRVLLAQMGL